MDELKYETLSTNKFWLEEGWYTVAELESFIEHSKKMNKHLQESMKPLKEKK